MQKKTIKWQKMKGKGQMRVCLRNGMELENSGTKCTHRHNNNPTHYKLIASTLFPEAFMSVVGISSVLANKAKTHKVDSYSTLFLHQGL